jgi:hypothetical protein
VSDGTKWRSPFAGTRGTLMWRNFVLFDAPGTVTDEISELPGSELS